MCNDTTIDTKGLYDPPSWTATFALEETAFVTAALEGCMMPWGQTQRLRYERDAPVHLSQSYVQPAIFWYTMPILVNMSKYSPGMLGRFSAGGGLIPSGC